MPLVSLERISPVLGSNTSTPLTLHADRAVALRRQMSMSGSPNTTNRLPLPVFFSSLGHVQVGVHLGLQDRQRAEAASARRNGRRS